MLILKRAVAAIASTLAVAVGSVGIASAGPKPPPVICHHHNQLGQCIVTVTGGGGGPGGGSGGTGGGHQTCTSNGHPVPCERPGLGTWDQDLNCYVEIQKPQPPKSDPVWQGHTDGAIYLCTTWPPTSTGTTEIWFATPPNAVDPRTLALQAERLVRLPRPSGHRSPSETQQYQGSPFTYVNLWTWFWTAPGTWRTRSATAHVGGVTATVTVTPDRLTFTPGDGAAPVSCTGPGKPWTPADGNAAPGDGGCGYQYRTATASPVTSTQSIRWSVTWTASDGANGTLPDLTTSRSGPLMVLQIESVVNGDR